MGCRTMMKEIFLEMGFEEMPTNNYVESSFWNFDTLFQPQQHPARDAHDTFFIEDLVQAGLQPLYRTVHGDLRLSPHIEEEGRDWQQWCLPSRDVAAHGAATRRDCYRLGCRVGEACDDQVQVRQHP